MDDKFKDAFTMNAVSSEERYDLEKFFKFTNDGFEAINSPFLAGLNNLPVWRYYRVNDGFKEIDQISYDAYGTLFYAWLIQNYNNTLEESFPEGIVLKLFRVEDLEDLYSKVSNGELDEIL